MGRIRSELATVAGRAAKVVEVLGRAELSPEAADLVAVGPGAVEEAEVAAADAGNACQVAPQVRYLDQAVWTAQCRQTANCLMEE